RWSRRWWAWSRTPIVGKRWANGRGPTCWRSTSPTSPPPGCTRTCAGWTRRSRDRAPGRRRRRPRGRRPGGRRPRRRGARRPPWPGRRRRRKGRCAPPARPPPPGPLRVPVRRHGVDRGPATGRVEGPLLRALVQQLLHASGTGRGRRGRRRATRPRGARDAGHRPGRGRLVHVPGPRRPHGSRRARARPPPRGGRRRAPRSEPRRGGRRALAAPRRAGRRAGPGPGELHALVAACARAAACPPAAPGPPDGDGTRGRPMSSEALHGVVRARAQARVVDDLARIDERVRGHISALIDAQMGPWIDGKHADVADVLHAYREAALAG